MEIISSRFDTQYPHVLTDITVDCRTKLRRRYLPVDLNARHLAFCMDTGIRPARAMNVDAATIDQRERLSQLALDRPEIALYLPPVKLCAVVLEEEFVIHAVV